MKKETVFALATFTSFFVIRLFHDVFLVQFMARHIICVTILGMYYTENLLALNWLRMENNMKALTFCNEIVLIQRRRKFKIQSKIRNNLNPVNVVISFHGTVIWHFIHLDWVMRGAALIFHYAAMLVGIRQQGIYKHIYFYVIHNNNKTHNIKCYNLTVLGYIFRPHCGHLQDNLYSLSAINVRTLWDPIVFTIMTYVR